MKPLLVAGILAWVGLGACVLLLAGADLGWQYAAGEVVVVTIAVVGARRTPGRPSQQQAEPRVATPSEMVLNAQWRSCLALLCVAVVVVGLLTTFAEPRPLATLVGLGTAAAAFGVALAGLR